MRKKILAVIGLRSGSKCLKDKNIKNLCGKPLFYYIYKAAKQSKHINRVIFSTDSKKYKKIINLIAYLFHNAQDRSAWWISIC